VRDQESLDEKYDDQPYAHVASLKAAVLGSKRAAGGQRSAC
jgi:hypothetical protein